MSKKQAHGHTGAATPALRVLAERGISYREHRFDGGQDHFGDHAAQALDVEPERILKTLMVELTTKGAKPTLAVACVPVHSRLSLKKVAAALGASKAAMADADVAARSSGYIPGGISPVGQKHPLPTVLHETAALADTVFVSGGRRGLDVELSPNDLCLVTNAVLADIEAEAGQR